MARGSKVEVYGKSIEEKRTTASLKAMDKKSAPVTARQPEPRRELEHLVAEPTMNVNNNRSVYVALTSHRS